MAQQTFIFGTTVIPSDWLNDVDNLVHGLFNNPDSNKIGLAANGDFHVGPVASPALFLDVSTNNLQIGKNLTTENANIEIGTGRTGNGNSFIDLIGDATYSGYGVRIIRGSGGANAITTLAHRGTGQLRINAQDAGSIVLQTNNTTALTIDSSQTIYLTGSTNEAKGSDIASATTTDIGAATGNYVDVTGITTVTGLGTVQAGTRRTVQFDGSLILTYNATSLILPGNANITTEAGDIAEFVSLGAGNWICTNYQKDTNPPFLYETGTWTPTIQDLSGSDAEGQVYTIQVGHYTKIGKIIHVFCRILISDIGTLTTTDSVFIAGLPYTVASNYPGSFVIGYANSLNITAGYSLTAIGSSASDKISLYMWDQISGVSDLTISELSAGAQIYLYGTYGSGF